MSRSGTTPTAILPMHKAGADTAGTDAEITDISVASYRGARTSFHRTGVDHWICKGNSSFVSLAALAAENSNRIEGSQISRIEIHSQLSANIAHLAQTVLYYVSHYGPVEPSHLFLGHWGGLRGKYKYRVYSNKKTLQGGTAYSEKIDLSEYLKAEINGSTVPTATSAPGLTAEQLRHVNLAYKRQNQDTYIAMEERAICVAPSWHYHAKALDLTWIAWGGSDEFGREWLTYSRPCIAQTDVDSGATEHRRIVAVEAALRKSFGTVLQRNYDNAHHNHFHADIGTPVAPSFGSGRSSSNNLFIRDCIRAFTDYDLEHVKVWDDDAKKGYEVLLTDFGMEGLDPQSTTDHYLLFLNFVMMHGFADKRAGHYRWEGGIY